VDTILFDEFVIDKGFQTYLPDEVTAFLELYETIARPGSRDYDVTCMFWGNAVTSANPYMDYFKLELPYKTDVWRRGEFLTQMVAPPELIEAKKGTRFYQAIAGSDYAAYAAENKWLRDNPKFIARKPNTSSRSFTTTMLSEYGATTETVAITCRKTLTASAATCSPPRRKTMSRTLCCSKVSNPRPIWLT
jgi:hypothetical protein